MRLEESVERFLTAKRKEELSPHTLDWYAIHLHAFVAWLYEEPERGVCWLQAETVVQYLAERSQRGAAPATVEGIWRALSVYFNWLVGKALIETKQNPMRGVKRPRIPAKEKRYVRKSEMDALLFTIPRDRWFHLRDRLAVQLMFYGGLRIGEAVSMQMGDFDVAHQVFLVREGKTGAALVPMLPEVATAFVEYGYAYPGHESGRAMLSSHGDGSVRGLLTTNGLRQRVKQLWQRAEMPYRNPHAFRHGLARYLLQEKRAPQSLIQNILRHKRLATTMEIYALWDNSSVAQAYIELMGDHRRKDGGYSTG